MKKLLYTILYVISLTLAGLSIHQAAAQVAQQRGPSVEPLAEVEIGASPSNGYDFSSQKRLPAGVRQKENSTKYSYIGPIFFFLLALPFALWMVISTKLKNSPEDKKAKYFSSTLQFHPYTTDYQKKDTEDDDEDIDYPKSA